MSMYMHVPFHRGLKSWFNPGLKRILPHGNIIKELYFSAEALGPSSGYEESLKNMVMTRRNQKLGFHLHMNIRENRDNLS